MSLAKHFKPRVILIEDASTGQALGPELKKLLIFTVKLVPVHGDKKGRMYVQQDKFEAGRVFLPEQAPYLAELEAELFSFPDGKTTDQVDSISQALAYEGSGYTLDHIR